MTRALRPNTVSGSTPASFCPTQSNRSVARCRLRISPGAYLSAIHVAPADRLEATYGYLIGEFQAGGLKPRPVPPHEAYLEFRTRELVRTEVRLPVDR